MFGRRPKVTPSRVWVERHPAPLPTPMTKKEIPMADSVVDPQVAATTTVITGAIATIQALQSQLADANKSLADALAARAQLKTATDQLASIVANITVK